MGLLWGIQAFRKFGRVERQLLAVAALSLTLVAIVLGLGDLAVSHLAGTAPSVRHAPGPPLGSTRS